MIAIFRSTWTRFRARCSDAMDATRYFWANCSPGGDCFLLLDVMLLVAGLKTATTSKWKGEHCIRHFTNWVFAYHGILFFLQLLHAMHNQGDDLAMVVWHVMKMAAWLVSALKVFMTLLLQKPLTEVRTFITSDRVNSDDKGYDELQQRNFDQFARTMMKLLYGFMILDSIIVSVPNYVMEMALQLPPQLLGSGKHVTGILHRFAVSFIPLSLFPRYFTNMTSNAILLLGMLAKLRMVARRYEQMLIEPDRDAELYYDRLYQKVEETLAHHLEYWRLLQVWKESIGKSFILVHYFAVFSIGAFFYVVKETKMDIFSVALASAPTYLLLVYYLFCHMVDRLEDEVDRIGDTIFEICAKMPHNRKHHSEYIQLRATFMIIWMNTRTGASMHCFRLFRITTATFVALLNTAYSVLTFLISIG